MIVHGVQPGELDKIFTLTVPRLVAIPRLIERYRIEDVYEEIRDGNWQLWLALDKTVEAACLTTIVEFPKRREIHLLGVAGHRAKEWAASGINLIEQYGRKMGCELIVAQAIRRGFGRYFPEYKLGRASLERKL